MRGLDLEGVGGGVREDLFCKVRADGARFVDRAPLESVRRVADGEYYVDLSAPVDLDDLVVDSPAFATIGRRIEGAARYDDLHFRVLTRASSAACLTDQEWSLSVKRRGLLSQQTFDEEVEAASRRVRPIVGSRRKALVLLCHLRGHPVDAGDPYPTEEQQAEAKERVKTIAAKAIVRRSGALDALSMLVTVGLAMDELAQLAGEEKAGDWRGIYQAAYQQARRIERSEVAGRARMELGESGDPWKELAATRMAMEGAEEERDQTRSRLEFAEKDRDSYRDRMFVALQAMEASDAQNARLKIALGKLEEVAASQSRLLQDRVLAPQTRGRGTCTCGRYPAGKCSRCLHDDRYNAEPRSHQTPGDQAPAIVALVRKVAPDALAALEGLGAAARDAELALGALEPVKLALRHGEPKLVVPAELVEGVREKLRSALGRVEEVRALAAGAAKPK